MRTIIGIGCALLSVSLLAYAALLSSCCGRGMPSLLLGLGLLLVAVWTLRPRARVR